MKNKWKNRWMEVVDLDGTLIKKPSLLMVRKEADEGEGYFGHKRVIPLCSMYFGGTCVFQLSSG